ncbi:MAG: tRNA (N6-isopentenyl adenosine(37)-C2)-methylthiotransferase MiaB [Thermodesulfobacteriota bacterium]|nr:tRNA (N6-isopentenyl adenosine(37)-C2)-methylthiotransferase MiaB [Thermodesulfobacteriota bacterium]
MLGYVKIFTYGCQMNDLDSLKMYTILENAGWEKTQDTQQADIVILNTCSVRQKAYEKALSNLGRLGKVKKSRPELIIAVTGCVAQQRGRAFVHDMPYIDIVLGTHQMHLLPKIMEDLQTRRKPIVETAWGNGIPAMDIIPGQSHIDPPHRAYINIMQGCNNYCTYCIVPFVRGREISRDYKKILHEIEHHLSHGVKEIFLLGQNVNSFSGGISFTDLLREIHAMDSLERLRFTTSHPKDMGKGLIACFGDLERLEAHCHLPFQSGSDTVLKAMNRGYTAQRYLDLIRALKASRPGMAFSADTIVGFPKETDKAFQETLDLIKEVKFDVLYSFKYSPRPGTRAAAFTDDVSPQEKAHRLRELQSLQKEITLENNQARVGKIVEVLVDGKGSRHEGQIHGRTMENTIVNFKGDAGLVGKIVEVKITRANPNSLTGDQTKGE